MVLLKQNESGQVRMIQGQTEACVKYTRQH